jgi:hypothetical protein
MVFPVCNPAIWEVELGASLTKTDLGKRGRPYLKNKMKAKELECGSSCKLGKPEALNSIPSSTKTHKQTKKPQRIG